MGLSDRFNHWQNDCIKALHINFESAEYCASFTSTNKYHTSLYFTTEQGTTIGEVCPKTI